MTQKSKNVAAFPDGWRQDGMTLRDFFAGLAVVGFASRWIETPTDYTFQLAAKEAYELADELLKARSLKNNE